MVDGLPLPDGRARQPAHRSGTLPSTVEWSRLTGKSGPPNTFLSEALAIERESDHQARLANALEMSARLAATGGQRALAIRLYARAALLRECVPGVLFEIGWPDPVLLRQRCRCCSPC